MQTDTENEVKTTTSPSPAFPGAFDLFKPSIEVLKRNLTSFIILLGIPTLLLFLASGPTTLSSPSRSATYGLFSLVTLVIFALTTPGVILLELTGARKEHLEYREAFSKGLSYFWRLVGLGICLFFIFLVSLLLFIVPFFFALRRYMLSPYYMIDRNLGIGAALKMSAEESKKYSGAIWGLIGVVVVINLVGIVPYIGTIASAVLSVLYGAAVAIRYLQIKAASEGQAPISPIEKDMLAGPKPTVPTAAV